MTRSTAQLSDDQILELFARWREHGDHTARDQIVDRYLPLAYSLARRYRGAREPISDLRQVACLGMLKAIDRFDPSLGSNFAPYAVPSILGELRRHFRDHGWSVHLPRGVQDLALRVEAARRELENLHPFVSASAIAEYLGITTEEVLEGLQASGGHHAVSYDAAPGAGDEELTVLDRVGELDAGFSCVELGIDIRRATAVLTTQERLVLERRFTQDRTQVQIATELGISQMQVSRILRRALDRLATQLEVDAPER